MTTLEKWRQRLRRLIRIPGSLENKASALIEGSANQARIINDKSNAIIHGLDNQSRLLNAKLNELIVAVDSQSRMLNAKLDRVIAGLGHEVEHCTSTSARNRFPSHAPLGARRAAGPDRR